MRAYVKLCAASAVVIAAATVVVTQPATATNNDDGADVVVDWNQLAQRTIVANQPFAQVRQFAMLHIAMADSVIAIEGRYEPFQVSAWAPRGASAKAAAAQAAHDVLVYLAPASLAAADTELAADLASVPAGPRWLGVQVGKKVAASVIGWRANDGAAASDPMPPTLAASTLTAIWRPTATGAARYSNWGAAEPFGVLSTTQFLPDAFPQLESARYATDFNEVKKGERPLPIPQPISTFTAEQRTALLWAGGALSGGIATQYSNVTNPLRVWLNVTGDVGQKENYSLVKMARLFALVSVSIHDSLQTAHTSKFIYRLWRPETAINNANDDNNPDTSPGMSPGATTWVPLINTPPYPGHSSNMTCIGAGAARMLANVFGTDAKTFTAAWYKNETITPPATRPEAAYSETLDSFKALAVEEGNSRVWGGIHFRFELDASHKACTKVADYIFDNKMQQDPSRH